MAYKIEENQERAGPFGRLRVNEPGPYKSKRTPRAQAAVPVPQEPKPALQVKQAVGADYQ